VFVLDPSETCGYRMSEQEHLLKEIESEFKGVTIMPVENKLDILSSESPRMKISAETGDGVPELVDEIVKVMKARAMESSKA